MSIRIPLLATLLVVFCLGVIDAQQHRRSEAPGILEAESVVFPGEREDKGKLFINYRILENFFIRIRHESPHPGGEYLGRGELIVEVFDERGQAVAREIQQIEIHREYPREDLPPFAYVEGGLSFELSPGEYRLLFRLKDGNSARETTERTSPIGVAVHTAGEADFFDMLFIRADESGPDTARLLPVNLGGDSEFGKDAYALTVFVAPPADDGNAPNVTAAVYRRTGEREDAEALYSITVPDEFVFSGMRVTQETGRDGVVYRLVESERSDIHAVIIPIRGRTLEEGAYRLAVTAEYGPHRTERNHEFAFRWVDIPLSLRNFDFALDMLEYITDRQEYRELRRGPAAERRRKFNAYWKSKDPDPETAYNPVLNEYYRRVDRAVREYSTIQEPNGARTDRGRVFIIYGSPTETDRTLTPGLPPQEVWIYTHLSLKFRFVDQSRQGNYRLIEREDL
jgi:GWxTD domain-containing protein